MSEIKSNTQETDEIVKKTIQKKSAPKKKVVKKVDEEKLSNETLEDNDNKEELIKKSVPKKTVSRKKVVKKDDDEDKLSENLEEPQKTKTVRRKVVKKKDTETEIDLSYLRVQTDECIFKMEVENKKKIKSEILSLIDTAHNILYNQENIEGENALNDIMNLMFIKSIAPILSDKKEEGKIDLFNYDYYKEYFDKETAETIFGYFKDLSNLSKEPLNVIRMSGDGTTDAIRQMGQILTKHKITKQIYIENNFINAKKAQTIQLLLNDVICNMDDKLLQSDEDIIGEIYEYIINQYVKTGSKLGQFFTPRSMMKLMFNYKNVRINEIISKIELNEKIKLCDTCMGTGGWLVTGFNMLKEKYGNRLFLSGGEVKPSTFQYGLMNLILTLQEFPHIVQCESSLTHIDKEKHHLVLTNPPFQTDKKFITIKENFETDEYTKENKIKLTDVYVLQNNNPPIQFLELDLYKLKENGLCIIILPYGELFFGESHQKSRSYFMKNANITDIILFEGGTFTHTGIKTCALIFEKDKTGTKAINFIKANKECSQLNLITTVSIDDINKEPVNSWYLRDYLKDEYIENLSTKLTNFQWIEFGDIFTLEKGQLQSSKVIEDENGDGVFINWSLYNKYKKISNCSLDGENLFLSTTMPNGKNGGYIVLKYYNGKCDYGDLMSKINISDKYKDKISLKYVYYFLNSIKSHIETIYEKGSCNRSLDQNNFNRMKIPIPTLEDQEKIIINITKLEELIILNTKSYESNDEMRKMYMEQMIKGATNKGINQFKTLGDVCDFNLGKRITEDKDGDENGLYPVYGGGDKSYYTNIYNREGKTCKISRFGMSEKNCVILLNEKYYLNDAGLTLSSNNINIIKNKYLWNYLILIKSSIFNTSRGTAQAGLGVELFKKLTIPIPPLEYQEKMEETLNMLDELKQYYKDMIVKINENIQTAFMNSLDDYGNPNGFNLDKILLQSENETSNLKEDLNIDEEKEEPIKIIKKKKVKTDK